MEMLNAQLCEGGVLPVSKYTANHVQDVVHRNLIALDPPAVLPLLRVKLPRNPTTPSLRIDFLLLPDRAAPPGHLGHLSDIAINRLTMATYLQGPDQVLDSSRPPKRRRFYRKRTDTEDDDASDTPPPPTVATPELHIGNQLISHNGHAGNDTVHTDEEASLSVADLVRQRKAIQRRRGGLEFTNLNPPISASNTTGSSDSLAIKEDETPANIKSVIERFASQTGQSSETTDKHMYVLPLMIS